MGLNQEIAVLLINPVQRITRLQLLLKEASKNFKKAGDVDCSEKINEAYDVATEICTYTNDLMQLGRMEGYNVSKANTVTCGKNEKFTQIEKIIRQTISLVIHLAKSVRANFRNTVEITEIYSHSILAKISSK